MTLGSLLGSVLKSDASDVEVKVRVMVSVNILLEGIILHSTGVRFDLSLYVFRSVFIEVLLRG